MGRDTQSAAQGSEKSSQPAMGGQILEAASAYLRAVLGTITEAIIGLDLDFRVTAWNQAAEELYGCAADDALGRPVTAVIRSDLDPHEFQHVLRTQVEGRPHPIEAVHYGRDGRRMAVESNGQAVLGPQGEVVGYVIAVHEINLRSRELFDLAPDGYLETDLLGAIRAANRAAARKLNLPREQLVGKPLLHFVVRADRPTFKTSFGELVRLTSPDAPSRRWELRLRPHKGEPFYAEITAARSGESSGPAALRWIFRDVTHRKQTEAALQDLTESLAETNAHLISLNENLETRVAERTAELEAVRLDLEYELAERERAEKLLQEYTLRLERSNRDLEDFAFIASHDLQEPLRKVISFGRLLRERAAGKLSLEEGEYLDRMAWATERMSRMLDSLLQYSRVSTQGRPFEPVDLREVAAEVVSDLQWRIETTAGRVVLADLPTIEADRTQMQQLFQNLIGNALKFRRPGVAPVVQVYAREAGAGLAGSPPPFVEVVVEDNGIGFDDQHRARLFQPFQRLVGHTEFEGSGMGLAICRKIAERHGGQIIAQSTPGHGSAFTFSLPLRQE